MERAGWPRHRRSSPAHASDRRHAPGRSAARAARPPRDAARAAPTRALPSGSSCRSACAVRSASTTASPGIAASASRRCADRPAAARRPAPRRAAIGQDQQAVERWRRQQRSADARASATRRRRPPPAGRRWRPRSTPLRYATNDVAASRRGTSRASMRRDDSRRRLDSMRGLRSQQAIDQAHQPCRRFRPHAWRPMPACAACAAPALRRRCRRRTAAVRRASRRGSGRAHTGRCAHRRFRRAPVPATGNRACRPPCRCACCRWWRANARRRNR